ncbi:MAG TPA: DoxX family protein [Stellaceae bacterium]|nr:DoxX family protein [Stellaceae bacterium]
MTAIASSVTSVASPPISNSKAMTRAGWAMSGLVILFMIFDAVGKLIVMTPVIEATRQIGYPEDLIQPLGVIALVCALLYAIPRTAVLGAILLTAFLGGAVASHLRLGDPLFSHVLFGVYVGLLAWGGLYLRDPQLRALIPLRRVG